MNILERYEKQHIQDNVPGTAVEYIAFQLARQNADLSSLPLYLIETNRDWRAALKRFAGRSLDSLESHGDSLPNHLT